MLKIIVLSLIGSKLVSPRLLFNSLKAYLIVYMLVLPVFLDGQVVERVNAKPGNFLINPELLNDTGLSDGVDGVYAIGINGCNEYWNGLAYESLFIYK